MPYKSVFSPGSPEIWPRGSAEYLSAFLLRERNEGKAKDLGCRHSKKIKPGIKSKIPNRLGFFRAWDDTALSYLETAKLCRNCYDKVIPDGFVTWSAFYRNAGVNSAVSEARYPQSQSPWVDENFFPVQYQAGAENFEALYCYEGRHPVSPPATVSAYTNVSQTKAFQILGQLEYDGTHFDPRRVVIPPSPENMMGWLWLSHLRRPFYIDLLHNDPPWRADLPAKEQRKEDFRIARANGAAYKGAAWIINTVPEGGSGPYTASEHRIAEEGSYRLLPMTELPPDRFFRSDTTSDEANITSVKLSQFDTFTVQVPKPCVQEIDPRWAGWSLGKNAYKHPNFMFYPSQDLIDKVTKAAIGKKLKPTRVEIRRRKDEAKLPSVYGPWLPRGWAGLEDVESVETSSVTFSMLPTLLELGPSAEDKAQTKLLRHQWLHGNTECHGIRDSSAEMAKHLAKDSVDDSDVEVPSHRFTARPEKANRRRVNAAGFILDGNGSPGEDVLRAKPRQRTFGQWVPFAWPALKQGGRYVYCHEEYNNLQDDEDITGDVCSMADWLLDLKAVSSVEERCCNSQLDHVEEIEERHDSDQETKTIMKMS